MTHVQKRVKPRTGREQRLGGKHAEPVREGGEVSEVRHW